MAIFLKVEAICIDCDDCFAYSAQYVSLIRIAQDIPRCIQASTYGIVCDWCNYG